ncbi:MAG: PIN domain-containing protein [Chloroflexota bacterium]|nr:PIN domain-containing protein [Chloroflexota bacterium]
MIFVDTSFWVALRNRRDDHHDAALWLFRSKAASPLLSTNHVRGETWTFLRRRAGHGSAADFLDVIEEAARLQVEHVDTATEDDALGWLRRHDEREYSFVDATSFALMRRLGVREAFAFDGDFAAAGFVELRP